MSIDQYRNKIISGDALTVLRQLPDESVHCVITSPPYWGLRKYEGKEQDQVWGGSKDCEHDFCVSTPPRRERHESDVKNPESKQATNLGANIELSDTAFCDRCAAWRGQLGLEPTPDLYVQHLVEVFREVKRVLRSDGALWLNMGDSYVADSYVREKGEQAFQSGEETRQQGWLAENRSESGKRRKNLSWTSDSGLKRKDLVGIPWRVAFALQADGWYLRSDIIWSKLNPMPESVQDRPTKSHEYVFLLAKSPQYFYDADAIREPSICADPESASYRKHGKSDSRSKHLGIEGVKPAFGNQGFWKPSSSGRNKRSVWTIPTQPYAGAHFAVFPEALVEPMVKAGTSEKGCCVKCGAPWEKIVKIDQIRHRKPWKDTKHPNGRNTEQLASWAAQYGSTTKVTTPIGWEPTCNCNTDTKPCIVLDPFVGSGTTCLVAAKLNRDWIGIDVSEKYCAMARERLAPYATKLEAFAS